MNNLYEILVPTVKSFDPPRFYRKRYHKLWDKQVRDLAGGLTILTPVKGQWVSTSGELFSERMIPVRISCSKEIIEKIADLVASHYNQKAVMFYRISDDVTIKHYGA